MKKIFTTSMIFASFALFANEPSLSTAGSILPEESRTSMLGKKISDTSKSFVYLKMSAVDSHPTSSFQVVPGLGIGYRLKSGSSAFDFSASYMKGFGHKGEKEAFFYTLPKVSYLYYLTPNEDLSLYAGIGTAWGKVKTKDERTFEGVIPSATVGYEINRKGSWGSFVELNVSQPAIAKQASDKWVGPIAEVSVGGGF